MEWNEYWGVYYDWLYPITVIMCITVGFVCGFQECKTREKTKKRNEDIRLAITNEIK